MIRVMPGCRKWFRRLAVAVALLPLSCWAIQLLVWPAILRWQVRSRLAGMGLVAADLRVRSIGLRHATITDLKLGEDQAFAAAAVEVDYGPLAPLHGRVGRISVIGARLRLAYRDGKLDLGSLGQIGRASCRERV